MLNVSSDTISPADLLDSTGEKSLSEVIISGLRQLLLGSDRRAAKVLESALNPMFAREHERVDVCGNEMRGAFLRTDIIIPERRRRKL